MKITVIHHSADFDGLFCREIARKFLPDAELIGWDFADKPLDPTDFKNQTIYVMDLPLDRPFGCVSPNWPKAVDSNAIWIDHHKSSIETHPTTIPGYRIDGVAACRLAWQWFTAWEKFKKQTSLDPDEPWFNDHYPFPKKSDYVNRKIIEPLAVRLAGEYDIWDKRDERTDVFQFGLRSRKLDTRDWQMMFDMKKPSIEEIEGLISVGHLNDLVNPDGTYTPPIVWGLLESGRILQTYQQRNDAGMMHRSFIVEFEGLKFLALTTARCNSLTFMSKDVPETGHDALMGFYFDGQKWNVSLYHAKHNTGIDLSQIAVKFGGGGHRGACGFRVDKLPFIQ